MAEETLDQYFARKPNDEEFHSYLFALLREKGIENAEAYKKAGIDRKTCGQERTKDAPQEG